jgi:hypothetical protein
MDRNQDKTLINSFMDTNDVDDQNVESTVDSILDQLKNSNALMKKTQSDLSEVVSKEDLEQFIINHSSKIIKMSTQSLDYVKDIVESAPTPDDISAMAELVKSTSIALDLLNKIVINDKKLDNAVKIKEMDIQSKKEELDAKVGATLLLNREEIMKQLLETSKVIPVDSEVIDKN